MLQGRFRILHLLHLFLFKDLTKAVHNLQTLILALLLVIELLWRSFDEHFETFQSELCMRHILRARVLDKDGWGLWDWADLSHGEHSFLCRQGEELFVSVSFEKNRGHVDINEDSPSIINFAAFGALVCILAKNFCEQAEGVAGIVWPKVLDLAFDKRGKLVNDAFQCIIVKLVQDAQVLHGVPLHAPLFITRIYSHLDSLGNEGTLKVQILRRNDVCELIKRAVFDDGRLQLCFDSGGLLRGSSAEHRLCSFYRFHFIKLFSCCRQMRLV